MSDTPITDKIIADADATPETRVVFLIKHLANQCKAFERVALVPTTLAPQRTEFNICKHCGADLEAQEVATTTGLSQKDYDSLVRDAMLWRKSSTLPQMIETAPKDNGGILAYSPTFYQGKGGWVAAVWVDAGWHSNPGGWRFQPTHWLPMPNVPPSAAAKKGCRAPQVCAYPQCTCPLEKP